MELRIERVVTEDELARAVAAALGVDRERIAVELAPAHGDFAILARITCPATPDVRILAAALETRLLADDGEGNAATAMLVTASDAVRVNVAGGVITGLHEHVDSDEVPDRLVVEKLTWTRGDVLRTALDAATPLPADAAPELQDAEHTLISRLRELVHRPATSDDERVVRRTCAILRTAGVVAMSDLLRCADLLFAAPWDPGAPS